MVLATEIDNGNRFVTTYVYGDGLISQKNSKNGYLTFHYNNIGSSMMLTDENGNVNEEYSYGPYGELLSGDASKTAYLYNGEYGVATDANGLYYMRARYYNVAIKRFINQDVITGTIDNSSSLNKYAYVQESVKQVAKSGKRVTKHVAKKVITKSKAAVKGAKKAVKNTVEKVAQKGKNIKKSIEKCQNCQK